MFEDLIDAFEEAARAWGVKGSYLPESWPELEENYNAARANLLAAIRELEGRAQQERRPATGKNR